MEYSEVDRRSAVAGRSEKAQSGVQGLWLSTAATLLSAIVFWFWLSSFTPIAKPAESSVSAGLSDMAPVDDKDIENALTTMSGPPGFLVDFKKRENFCSRPLAWVSVMLEPGQPAGTVRVRSGNYFSPLFRLTDKPLRIAVPYPNSYETGHGKLTVMGTGGSAIVALRPVWHASDQNGAVMHDVTWNPVKHCEQPNG